MNTQAQAGGVTDLLSSILGITIRNEEKISESDRAFCQCKQDQLYKSLDQLDEWYALFKSEADKYIETKKIVYTENGSVKDEYEYYSRYSCDREDYTDFEFWPFKEINKIVELRYKAIAAFAKDIVMYFNKTYNISANTPETEQQTLPVSFRPVYITYVNHVIGHLGGRGFRETAREELITCFLNVVKPWNWDTSKPEIKGNSIVFPRAVKYQDYSWELGNKISWSHLPEFNNFCAGILFSATTILNGHAGCIMDFDYENVDFSKWYNMTPGGKVQIKLYKNGRADVKFSEKRFTEQCFKALRLDTLKLHNDVY